MFYNSAYIIKTCSQEFRYNRHIIDLSIARERRFLVINKWLFIVNISRDGIIIRATLDYVVSSRASLFSLFASCSSRMLQAYLQYYSIAAIAILHPHSSCVAACLHGIIGWFTNTKKRFS